MTTARLTGHKDVVAFRLEPDVRYIAKSPLEANRRPPKSGLKMAKRIYEKYDGSQATDSMLQEASQLFSENYGVWGKNAVRVERAFAKEGKLPQVDSRIGLRAIGSRLFSTSDGSPKA